MSELPEITFWMLGGLWNITWRELLTILPVVSISISVLFFMRWRLNVLSLDDETAFSLGLAPGRERLIFLVTATAATASIVSVSGIVSWVGLIIPHISRRIFRTDTRYSLPGSMILGEFSVLSAIHLPELFLPEKSPWVFLPLFSAREHLLFSL